MPLDSSLPTKKRSRQKIVHGADLFCGAGGTSTGMLQAIEELGLKPKLIAVNHWDVAIATVHQPAGLRSRRAVYRQVLWK